MTKKEFDVYAFLSIFAQKLTDEGYELGAVAVACAELWVYVKDMEVYLNE